MPDTSRPQQAPQRVIKTRREYNIWVADESIEDYALRYAPTSVRKWSPWTVTNTAISTVSFWLWKPLGQPCFGSMALAMHYGQQLSYVPLYFNQLAD